MNFINLNSNRGLVNLLSDFILLELNEYEKYDSVVEVTDFGRFFVVNGFTSRNDLIDLSNITEKFKKEYSELLTELGYKELNVIDLIIYDSKLNEKDEFWFTFYNTERPSYCERVIELSSKNVKYQKIKNTSIELDFSETNTDNLGYFTYSPLNISSEFPHGYSFNMGRKYYYYSEYICNHLFNTITNNDINFKCSIKQNSEDDFNIEILTKSIYPNDKIKSLVLDVFDFNLNEFKNKLSGYNYIDDITKPFDSKPWLIRDRIRDILIF